MKKITLIALVSIIFAGVSYGQTVSAKFGKGIKFTAADTSFSLKFRYRQQQLFETTFSEQADGGLEEGATNFQVRRSRLKFSGHAFTPKLTYKAELGLTSRDISTSSEDGNTRGSSRIILDAVLKYQFSKSWAIWVGQTKLPGNRERVISSANLQFVNRSQVNSRFNIDRDAGFQLRGKYKLGEAIIKPTFSLSKGEGRGISSNNIGGLDYTAHVDFLPLGKFANKKGDYVSSDLARNETPKLSIGLTYDLNDRASRAGGQLGSFVVDASTGEYAANTLQTFIADAMFKYKGISWATEYAMRSGDNEDFNSEYRLGSGFVTQVGYLLPSNLEIAGRFTAMRAADQSSISSNNEYTLGVSKYIVGHALKIQSDISRIDNTLTDGLDDYRFRLQMEMQF